MREAPRAPPSLLNLPPMNWSDEGIVLSARRHGENSVVVQLLTRGQGRHAGLVRGGQGKRARGIYQPGNLVAARWSARWPSTWATTPASWWRSVPRLRDIAATSPFN